MYERVGTVHTVQGREAEAIFFILGAPNAEQRGARGWAGGRPNLLNVAVTRAKEVVYVIGKLSGKARVYFSRLINSCCSESRRHCRTVGLSCGGRA
ncbi:MULTISPECIES: AAA domain-containing protein [unclassified Mesorhizobium]|uniref:AAA domain-containing protein n=1 Tax=unclassified Mesorhizobium TaxID=325217 RepID=UPI001AEE4AFE|nr:MULTISPECIES: AAA domain-containing protein [unclassified Mesorhizobium]